MCTDIKRLEDAGYIINEVRDIQNGKKYFFKNVNYQIKVFNTGTVNVDGIHNRSEEFKSKMAQIKALFKVELSQYNKQVVDIIHQGVETNYADFKEKYTEQNNEKLLKSIIFLANNIENRDAFLIYGVTDKKHTPNNMFQVCGVDPENMMDEQRLSQLFQGIKFATATPTVKLEKIFYQDKILQVLIIEKSSKNVPYYLDSNSKEYPSLKRGVIYSRDFTSNTSADQVAKYETIRQLWAYNLGAIEK